MVFSAVSATPTEALPQPAVLPHELMHILLNSPLRTPPGNSSISLDPDTAIFTFPAGPTKSVIGTKRIGPYPDAAQAEQGQNDSKTMRDNSETLS